MVSILSALILSASPAASGPGAGDEQERFKAFVLQGERMFGEGDFGAAVWNFRQADAIRVTPELAYNLARVHERLGDGALSAYYYRLYLRRAPEAKDALQVAEILGELLSQAEAEGRGLVEIEAPVPGTATLAGMTYADFPVALFLPPGDYEVKAQFPSGVVHQRVSAKTGRVTSFKVEPITVPLMSAEGSLAGPQALASSRASASSGRTAVRVSSFALLGSGAAALAAGAVFGLMSRDEATRVQAGRSTMTFTKANALAESANGKGALANVLFVAGSASALVGGAMFVFTLPEPGGVGGDRR